MDLSVTNQIAVLLQAFSNGNLEAVEQSIDYITSALPLKSTSMVETAMVRYSRTR